MITNPQIYMLDGQPMVSVPVHELTERALNYAVAVAEGRKVVLWKSGDGRYFPAEKWSENPAGDCTLMRQSQDWKQGGEIIERERIALSPSTETPNVLASLFNVEKGTAFHARASTPLTAAMLCYVGSRLGGAIDVPEVLLDHKGIAP